jgi:transposase
LFTRRRLAREGQLKAGDDVPAFVPVEISATPASVSTCALQPSSLPAQHSRTGLIEIELGDCRVRVDRDVVVEALVRVLALLGRR